MSTQKTWPLSFSIGYKNPPKKSMWPFDLEFQSWTKGILMSSQTVHLAHFSTFSLSWNRGFLCPLIAWQSMTNLSFHSGRNSLKKSHFIHSEIIFDLMFGMTFQTFKKSYRCPKFDSYAMQTLEIRVEQKESSMKRITSFQKLVKLKCHFLKPKERKKYRKDLLIT